ncbi:MAG: mannose-1-phosphate guanylyltransferase/mannose-6-phosphate isomerase [Desulfovibrionaceae bacterium]
MIRPVVLCGGKGSRLWPLSRELYPKQFLAVHGNLTLLQETILRAQAVTNALEEQGAGPVMAICNQEHRFWVAEQREQLGSKGEIVLEPMGRDTAAPVAVAALLADPDDLLFIMPSDHVIHDREMLRRAVEHGAALAREGWLVTFGIEPTVPETGYGYILEGSPIREEGFAVERFVEKPDLAAAKAYLASGRYCWNSGMFLLRAGTVLEELGNHAPDVLSSCRAAVSSATRDLDFIRLGEAAFSGCRAECFDRAVLEKTDRCAVVPLRAGWSDLGTWGAFYDEGGKDASGNVLRGDVLAEQSENCYLHAEGHLVCALGLSDVIVVETADAVLVADRNRPQLVKEVYSRLRAEGREEAVAHRKTYRPWGSFESMDRGGRFQVKRITVKPGQVLSLQKHYHRAEHWVVVSGTAQVTNGEREFLLTEDQSTYIPVGHVHRLANPGNIPLELIEVQTGAYLGEDDIVRFEDVYGRSRTRPEGALTEESPEEASPALAE